MMSTWKLQVCILQLHYQKQSECLYMCKMLLLNFCLDLGASHFLFVGRRED